MGMSMHVDARRAQAEAVARDTSPTFEFGRAKGVFTGRYDGYAPDEGAPMRMSAKDLRTHLAVFGGTGSGKTSAMLRVLIAQWARSQAGGMLVLDGKGALASELDGLRGYTCIKPGVKLGLMDGLSPGDFTAALVAVSRNPKQESATQSGQFFATAGETLVFNGSTLLRALVDSGTEQWKWHLAGIHRLLSQLTGKDASQHAKEVIEAILRYQPAHRGEAILLEDAVGYFSEYLPAMDHETRANLWATVHGWLSPIFQHRDLVEWAHTHDGLDISNILWGGMYGVALPQYKFGRAGATIQSFLKQRTFSLERGRADIDWEGQGQKQVMTCVDEAQEMIGPTDEAFLPVARSLGGVGVYASQSVDAFIAKIASEAAAKAWLDNFQSFAMLRSSEATYEWASSRLGMTKKLRWMGQSGMINYPRSLEQAFKSSLYDADHPAAGAMQWLRRKGAGAFDISDQKTTGRGTAHTRQDAHAHDLRMPAIQQCKWETAPLLESHEADAMLQEPFTACIQVMRGGVRRRDIVKLEPMFEFPPDLLEDAGKSAKSQSDERAKPMGPQEPMHSSRRPAAPKPPVDLTKTTQEAQPKPADDMPRPKVKESIK